VGNKGETTASKENVQPATNNKKSSCKERKQATAKEAHARNNTSSQSKVAEHQPEEEPFFDQPASPSAMDQLASKAGPAQYV
jgi:hypothetical protein